MRISDWSSDVCSSDLAVADLDRTRHRRERVLDIVPPRHRQVNAPDRAAIPVAVAHDDVEAVAVGARRSIEIGRASRRERVCLSVLILVVALSFNKKHYYDLYPNKTAITIIYIT